MKIKHLMQTRHHGETICRRFPAEVSEMGDEIINLARQSRDFDLSSVDGACPECLKILTEQEEEMLFSMQREWCCPGRLIFHITDQDFQRSRNLSR